MLRRRSSAQLPPCTSYNCAYHNPVNRIFGELGKSPLLRTAPHSRAPRCIPTPRRALLRYRLDASHHMLSTVSSPPGGSSCCSRPNSGGGLPELATGRTEAALIQGSYESLHGSDAVHRSSQAMLAGVFYFIQVVDRGGYTSASKSLGLPKSTLSHRIRALEDVLGVTLLTRTSRRFRRHRSRDAILSLRADPAVQRGQDLLHLLSLSCYQRYSMKFARTWR